MLTKPAQKDTASRSSQDEAAVTGTPISKNYITDRSYVRAILLMLAWEKSGLEKHLPEQPGLDWNKVLSLRLDAVNAAIETLCGLYGPGDE